MIHERNVSILNESFAGLCTRFFSRFAWAFAFVAERAPANTMSMNLELILKKLHHEQLLPNDRFDELVRDSIMLDYAFGGDMKAIAETVFLKVLYDDYWAESQLDTADFAVMKEASRVLFRD
ncbi:MAG: hypothetical protein JW874_14080 [Spirochaetales bacterium]|nr:hypothetical protein [Spirochaetales bacterium]